MEMYSGVFAVGAILGALFLVLAQSIWKGFSSQCLPAHYRMTRQEEHVFMLMLGSYAETEARECPHAYTDRLFRLGVLRMWMAHVPYTTVKMVLDSLGWKGVWDLCIEHMEDYGDGGTCAKELLQNPCLGNPNEIMEGTEK